MYYLYLEFKSADLIVDSKSNSKSTDYRRDENSIYKSTSYEVDLDNPLKVNHISNMLHYLFGYPPVPSMRKSIFTINEEIYDLALNHSYVKYDNKYFYITKKGDKRFLTTTFWSQKANFDSNRRVTTFVGSEKYQGNFTWESFKAQFKPKWFNYPSFVKMKERNKNCDEPLFDIVKNFFNKLLGCEDVIKKYSFPEFLVEIRKYVDSDEMKSFKKEYGDRLKIISSQGWYEAVFNGNIKNSTTSHNCGCSSKCPILERHGIKSKKVTYNGRIIVEIENEKLIEELRQYGRIPTIMDGGVVKILGIGKLPPMFDWKEEFTKISE